MSNSNIIDDDFDKLNQDFMELCSILSNDIFEIERCLNKKNNQVWRRVYVKSIFSSMDSVIHFLKSHIILVREVDYLPLDDSEELILYSHVKGKKSMGMKNKSLPFLKNLVFILELFADTNHFSIEIDKNTKEWNYLVIATQVRNRVTHPKTKKEMEITERELIASKEAFKFFFNVVLQIMETSADVLKKEANGLDDFLKANFNRHPKIDFSGVPPSK